MPDTCRTRKSVLPLLRAGCCVVLGRRTGVVLERDLDEAPHTKALYRATDFERGGGDGMDLGRP